MTVRTNEELLRTLMGNPETRAIAAKLSSVFGVPEQPLDACWLAVDADAIREQGIVAGLLDTGIGCDLQETDWQRIAEALDMPLDWAGAS